MKKQPDIEFPSPEESFSRSQLMKICEIQHLLIRALLFDCQQLANAVEGADARSRDVFGQWLEAVSNRVRGANEDVQKVFQSLSGPVN